MNLVVGGVKLHKRFSKLALKALKKLKAKPILPPLPKGRVYRQVDGEIRESSATELPVVRTRMLRGAGRRIQITTGVSRNWSRLTEAERSVLRTLRMLAFRRKP